MTSLNLCSYKIIKSHLQITIVHPSKPYLCSLFCWRSRRLRHFPVNSNAHKSLHAHFRFIRNVYKQNNNKNTHDSPKSRNCFIDRGDGENFEKWSMCLGTLAKAEFFVISLTNFIAKYWLTLWRDWTKHKALLLICTAFTSRNTRYVCPQKTSPAEWKPSANQNPRFKVLLQLCPIRHVGGTSLNACYVSLLEAAHSKHVCLEQCLCQPAFQTAQDVKQIQL